MQTPLPLSTNPSFGFIFETLFLLPPLFQEGERREKEKHRKKVRVRVKERGNFLLWVRWEGMEEMQRFIWRKKGKMSA